MHSVLRHFSPFSYIGCPIDEWDWRFRWCNDIEEVVNGDKYFVSGDYSAATDGLDPSLSEYTMDQILKKVKDGRTGEILIDTFWRDLSRKALTGHILRYPYSIFEHNEKLFIKLSSQLNARSVCVRGENFLELEQVWG